MDTGDEPHYLVLINSVISDGDFDLANNYRDVHRGGPRLGVSLPAGARPSRQLVSGWPTGEMVAGL